MNIKIKRFDKNLPLPTYDGKAAGFDLICREGVVIEPGEIKLVPVNIAVQVPDGYALLLFVRSSTPLKKGLILANSVGIVDPFYCGDRDEIMVELLNVTNEQVKVNRGDKLTQGMFVKIDPVTWNEVEKMEDDGTAGFGKRHKN